MSTDGSVDEGVDKGVRILSLDSGGPGTYSQLLIIKEYMVRLANDLGINEGDVYPADYFDLMGGVGFGGLVAILLGHLWMNVDEAIDALLNVALAIFPDNPDSNPDQEACTRQLSESMESLLQTRGIPRDRKMHDTDEKTVGCKVALYAATAANLSHPIVLRNYKPRGSSLNPTIVEAICATMATPSYFSSIKIGPRGRQQTFIGGPLGANNPTRELLKEAGSVFGKEKLVTQVISLGCGRSNIPSMENNSNPEGVSRSVQGMAADCEAVAKELSTRLVDMDVYLRLDVERGMENLHMSEWNDLGPIQTHTSAYFEMAEISESFEASLRRLQGGTGTVTLGEINHLRDAKDARDKLEKQMQNFDRTSGSMKDIEDFRILDRLKPVDAPSYYESRSCMKDTRKLILDQTVTWAETPLETNGQMNGRASEHMFWLYGSPGLGKTSIANSLCHRLHKIGGLGGSFFCRRDDPVLCDPNRVLPTLLHKLAWMWNPYRDLVVQAVRGDPNFNPDWTGCALLLEHLYSLQKHPQAPLVLVVDALDECGDPRTRARLLRYCSEICARVNWIKIVVTSRPEQDITSFFQKLDLAGHDLSKDIQAYQDIRNFTKCRMASLAEQYCLPSDWPGESRREQIARRSGGLFIFVEALYQFLDDPDPELLLTQVLCGNLGDADATLHKLYSTAIETRIGRNKEHFRLFVQALVTVATHRSLTDKTLASLIGLEPRVISSWVNGLSSLLYRDMLENGAIRARHLSVIEFLTSPTCPAEFRVDVQEANGLLGYRCIVTMTKELEFNICKLETSCLLNAEIQDLDDRVQEKISDALQYSCMHWSSHLCSGSLPVSQEVCDLLSTFLTGARLLYWLEVLSLMGKVPVAIQALRLMKMNLKKLEGHHQRPVEEALRFVLGFFTPISTSTPHIYLSGLSFMPVKCSLWKYASPSFPELIDVCKGRLKSWPAPSGVWHGHTKIIHSVAYSPDGLNIISGSEDDTIRIWDVDTGAAVGEPLKGHTKGVASVAYSPAGRIFASGSSDNTIRIWDAQTGVVVGERLEGHTEFINSVAFSPDGRNVVSGSADKTIRMWDAQTGAGVGEPLKGHTDGITSVAYSPDGRNIVSGSWDETIRIWDVQTGAVFGEPLKGHARGVTSVTYSPDGRSIVSGSWDETVRIWDVQTGVLVGEPLKGHCEAVISVAYSPDGRNIASSSWDQTIRIWDVKTGVLVGEPLKGHTAGVVSVAYSPDGRNVISGSFDETIRIWDVKTGAAVGEPSKGHTGRVCSFAYSPDGRNVISGSSDQTIRIWDVQTGLLVGEPLKGHTGGVISVAYSPDGRNIISGSNDNTVRMWDAETRAVVGETLTGHTGAVRSVACSPDGRNIASGSWGKTTWIWDVEAGAAVIGPLKGHGGPVVSVAYSPDGRNIASSSWDETIRIWDVKTGVLVGEPLRGHTASVISVAYSPDGRNIASVSWDRTIRIWDAKTGVLVGEPLKGHTAGVVSVAYSPDGRNIASGSWDQTIQIWDVQTGAAVGEPLRGHTGGINTIVYSPDGRNIVSGSWDHTIRIWNAETGAAIGDPLKGHCEAVISVAYSLDGRNIISGSIDSTIRMWEARTNIEDDGHSTTSESSSPSSDYFPLVSGLPIPAEMIDMNGWVHGPEGILFWVPEDCRRGLTSPAIATIPNTGRQRTVRIDFSRFQYGTLWTKVRGSNVEGQS